MIPTVVITTRGDVPLGPILESIPDWCPVVVWDNSQRPWDAKVFGYFAALAEVETEYVITQADDTIIPIETLCAAWTPDLADKILVNVADGDTPWVSFGGMFHKDLPWPAINAYIDAYHDGQLHDDVLLWCEVIFAALTPWVGVDLGADHLPYHAAANRMCVMPTHYTEQARVRELAQALAVTA